MAVPAQTNVTISSHNVDSLDSVRRLVAFCDAMTAEGAEVVVTGHLYADVTFPSPPTEDDADAGERGPA